MGGFWFEAGALVPSIGVGLLFWFAIRAILSADRREREADRRAEEELYAAHSTALNSLRSAEKPADDPKRATRQ